MARLTPLHLVPALLAAATHAGEITIQPQPFFIAHAFTATVIPLEPVLIQPVGKKWTEFQISAIAPHGARLNPGDLIARFDTAAIDHEITGIRLTNDANTLAVNDAALALAQFSESAPIRIAALRLTARQAKEDLDYFTASGRKAAENRAAQSLKAATHFLAQQREELTQLVKIHQPEPQPDSPEPLIIARQRDAVATAEFTFRMETLDQDRTLKVLIPREAEALAARANETALAVKQAEELTQQQLAAKKFAVDAAKLTAAQSARDLADLEADRQLFEIKAPSAGWLFHGSSDPLPASGKPALATFVPAASKLGLIARLSESAARTLTKDLEGIATLPGQPDRTIPLKISAISDLPAADGLHRIEITATWPEGFQPNPATTLEAKFASHHKPAAISVPHKALTYGPTGWTVQVKLADGKSEPRPVKPGLVSEYTTEILSGLEPGQVVVVPNESR